MLSGGGVGIFDMARPSCAQLQPGRIGFWSFVDLTGFSSEKAGEQRRESTEFRRALWIESRSAPPPAAHRQRSSATGGGAQTQETPPRPSARLKKPLLFAFVDVFVGVHSRCWRGGLWGGVGEVRQQRYLARPAAFTVCACEANPLAAAWIVQALRWLPLDARVDALDEIVPTPHCLPLADTFNRNDTALRRDEARYSSVTTTSFRLIRPTGRDVRSGSA